MCHIYIPLINKFMMDKGEGVYNWFFLEILISR